MLKSINYKKTSSISLIPVGNYCFNMSTKDPISHQNISLRTLLRNATHHHHAKLNQHPLLAGLIKPNYPLKNYCTLLLAYFKLYQLMEDPIRQFLYDHSTVFNFDPIETD